MSALRKQMEADMVLRGLAYRTRESYLEAVAKLAKFYGRSPDRISRKRMPALSAAPARRSASSRTAAATWWRARCSSSTGSRSSAGGGVLSAAPEAAAEAAADPLARGGRDALRARRRI